MQADAYSSQYAIANWLKFLFCPTSVPSDSVIAGRVLLGQKNEDATLTSGSGRQRRPKKKKSLAIEPVRLYYGYLLQM
jgi:hypothetical protein